MEDSNMEDVEKHRIDQRSPSPPRKKIKAESTEPIAPSSIRHKINAHDGMCKSILFLNNTHTLVSGGKDSAIKLWDTSSGTLTSTMQGFQGTVCDLAISSDNSLLAATLTSNKLSIWDLNSGLNLQTMNNWNQVSTVAISGPLSRFLVGLTIIVSSKYGTYEMKIPVWPSICSLQGGNVMLTSGRDNLHNLVDVRSNASVQEI